MGTFRALGHGTVNFPAVKAALEEVGFDGVLCVELDRPEVCNFHSAEVSPHLPAGRAGHLRGPGYKKTGGGRQAGCVAFRCIWGVLTGPGPSHSAEGAGLSFAWAVLPAQS